MLTYLNSVECVHVCVLMFCLVEACRDEERLGLRVGLRALCLKVDLCG